MGPATTSTRCPACDDLVPAGARFCPACGARIASAEGERRTLTIVFAQAVGTGDGGGDLDEVRRAVSTAASELTAIVARFGGSVDKVMTDTVMAVWGAPVAHEDDPERAVRAALAMREVGARGTLGDVALRIGITTGEAIWTPVGPSGAFTALGDAVNTAARLEQAATPGDILVGEPTVRAIAGTVAFEAVPPIEAKNKSEPLVAFRPTDGPGAITADLVARAPLIGRARELEKLLSRWEQNDAAGRLIVVGGAPGVGKSRMVREFVTRVGPDATAHRGHCLSYGEGITYWPIIEVIKQASGIQHDEADDATALKLGTFLEGLAIPDPLHQRLVAVALANLIAAPRTPRGTYSAASVSKGELHAGVRMLFERLSAQHPRILVIEDLHHAEPTLLDLLTFLAGADGPLMVVATARPELADLAPDEPPWDTVEVEPLADDSARELLSTLTGGSPDGLERLLDAADGNPLFLEEIVRAAKETGTIAADGTVSRQGLDLMAVPDSLGGLIASRLDRMTDAARRVAGLASIVGSVFWSDALLALAEVPHGVDAALLELQARDIVRELPTSSIAGQREFAFKNALTRDVVYGRVPKEQRAVLHERCARWIAGLGRASEFVEFEAYHLEQACRLSRELPGAVDAPLVPAAEALIASAERARARQGVSEADRFLERALSISEGTLPEMTLEITLRRTKVQLSLGDIAGALRQLEGCAETALTMDRHDLRANALADLAQLTSMTSDDRALAWSYAREASRLASALARPRLEIITRMREGDLHQDEGALDDAIAAYEEVIDRTRHEVEERSIEISASLRLATLFLNAGRFERAERLLARTLEVATAHGNLREQGIASTLMAAIRYFTGPHDEAIELAERGVRSFQLSPDRMMHVQALDLLAKIALHAGDDATALTRAEEARALAGTSSVLGADLDALLVRILLRRRRFDDARAITTDLSRRAEGGDAGARLPAMLTAAYQATADGDPETYVPLYEDAVEAKERAGARVEAAEVLIALGRALARGGHGNRAEEAFERAGAIFAESGASAMLDVIERERDALTER